MEGGVRIQQLAIGWIGFVLISMTGCAYEGELGPSSTAQLQSIEAFEQIDWQLEIGEMGEWRSQLPGMSGPVNPCQCPGRECLDDWVEHNFGCNVCVSYSCGEGVNHVCTPC